MARTDEEDDPLWSERRFRSLVEATATEVFRNAPDGRLLSDMPRWRRLTGQTAEQIAGFGWLDAVHPDDLARVEREWRDAVERGEVFDAQYRVARADGAWVHVWVRSAPLRDDAGRIAEYVGLYHDITDRVEKRREAERLRQDLDLESHILERVVEASPVGVALLWGPDHRFRLVNPAYEASVPQRGGPLVGRAVAEVFPETARVIPLLDRVRAGEAARSTDIEVPFGGPEAVDGHRHYHTSLSPVLETDGSPGGILATVIEITDEVRRRRGLERELQHERQVAETLQRTLLPDALPDIPGVELCVRYEPASDGGFVGGDWYDVFDVGAGRVVVAVGDVAGRGLQAATVMGQLRAALRAYAVEDPAPDSVLARMDELVDRLGGSATLAYGLLDTNDWRLCQGLAGHPPPLLVAAGGEASWLDDALGTPLGAPTGARRNAEIDVPAGALLFYYTDGLLQERELGIQAGMDVLRASVARAGADGAALGDVCHDVLDARASGEDDRALLIVRRT